MASLISDAEKAIYSQVLVDLADTFETDITIYKMPTETVIATDENYNQFFQNSQAFVSYTPVSQTFKARLLYNKKQDLQRESQGAQSQQIDITEELGELRIKVRPEAVEWLRHNQNIIVNGENFELASAPRPHGLFTTQFYTYFLKRKV